jgi:hypothetical protein
MPEAGESVDDRFLQFFMGWWRGVFAGVFGEKPVQSVVFLW